MIKDSKALMKPFEWIMDIDPPAIVAYINHTQMQLNTTR